MWLFLTARLRQWLFLAVLIPTATIAVRLLRTQLEKKSGPTRMTRSLLRLEQLGQRRRQA